MIETFFVLLSENFTSVESFFEAGGSILYAIATVAFLMWTLLLERVFYIYFSFQKEKKHAILLFLNNSQPTQYQNENYKKMILSMMNIKLKTFTYTLKTLIAICPMLGLLGTVLGMIEVFDVVSMLGTENAKAMADGVSKATIPTMSGMFVSLSGVFFLFLYQRKILKEEFIVKEKLEAIR